MSQELAASLLACAFLNLFPIARRDERYLPAINMDTMFEGLQQRPDQVHKLHCLVNYFNRVCEAMPHGTISYERKVLPRANKVMHPEFWSHNHAALCSFHVLDQGTIEDAGCEYAQVDFANKFVGGGVLRLGCLQEEIRFMLSPELIVGMLFLPAMADNEAIEITGSERFSSYTGYGKQFQYAGDFVDPTPRDSWCRRCTKIIAIDAVERPGQAQFQDKLLLRELCKAYCGFLSTDEKVAFISEGMRIAHYGDLLSLYQLLHLSGTVGLAEICSLLSLCYDRQTRVRDMKELRLGTGAVGHLEGIFPSRACCSGLQHRKQVVLR